MIPTAEYQELTRVWVRHARRVALDDGRARIDYGSLDRRVADVVGELARLGPRRIGLVAENGMGWALVQLAALRAGLALVALPTFFSAAQRACAIADAGLDLIITDDEALGDELDAGVERVRLHAADLSAFVAPRSGAGRRAPLEPFARVTFTSGSSGTPKGVKLAPTALLEVARSLRHATSMRADDQHLCALPLSVLLEEVGGLLRALGAGARVLLPSAAQRGLAGSTGFDPERFARCLCERHVTSTILVPHMLATWIEVLEDGRARVPDALRFVGVGGALVPHALLERAAALGLPVFEGYGMSEACSVVTLNTARAHRPGSAGRPLRHARVRIAPDGEILVAGVVSSGVLGGGAFELDGDGFWATGDVGRLDGDGYLIVHGRKDERIVTSYGRNVSPEWVERELECEPVIARAAVLGAGRPWPCAVIVASSAAGPAPAAAVAHALERANARLPDYARVRTVVLARAPFTVRDGTATPKGTPRRAAIAALYRTEIDGSVTGRMGA